MKKIGILIIHGFGGHITEVVHLSKELQKRNYDVKSPLLAGHGLSKKDLSKTKYTDWINSAFREYQNLCDHFEKVVIIGFSMGGLIAANLFEIRPFDVLITINTPIYFWNFKKMRENLFDDFGVHFKKYIKSSADKPLNSLIEFLKILKISKKKFANISCSTLIIQSLDDDTVKPKSAIYISKNITGKQHSIYYKTGGHDILNTANVFNISENIEKFIAQELL